MFIYPPRASERGIGSYKQLKKVFSCNISSIRLLKTLTLLFFVLVSVNSFAQSYKVTVKEIHMDCERNFSGLHMCFGGVDNTELTPLCGPSHCSGHNPMKAPLSLPSRLTNEESAELSFPASGKVEAYVNFFRGLSPSALEFGEDELGFIYSGMVIDEPSAVKGTFRVPAFTMSGLDSFTNRPLPNPGECKEGALPAKGKFKKQLRVAANQIAQVRANFSGYNYSEGYTVPPGLVTIPDGQIARMKTNFNRTIPLKDRKYFLVEVCNTEIQGFIDISLSFRTLAAAHSASWDFSGGLRVSASPTDETLQDYVGTIGVSAMIFSSDVDGALINAEVAATDTISTTFRYEEDSDPNDNILGWMEIDFSSLSNQQWQSFELQWVVDGRTINQEFPNVYAIGLGQLLKNSPGSSPLSMKLPVIEQGGDPMTLTVSGGGHPLTIEYALFGGPGS